MTDSSDTENPQMVHLVFGNGKWPEDPTKLLGVYADDEEAQSVAEYAEVDWYNTYVQSEEVIR